MNNIDLNMVREDYEVFWIEKRFNRKIKRKIAKYKESIDRVHIGVEVFKPMNEIRDELLEGCESCERKEIEWVEGIIVI